MSVHVPEQRPPFRIAANAASRKTDGAPYGTRPVTPGLTGLQIVGLEEQQRQAGEMGLQRRLIGRDVALDRLDRRLARVAGSLLWFFFWFQFQVYEIIF